MSMFGSFLPSLGRQATTVYSGRGSRHCYEIKCRSANPQNAKEIWNISGLYNVDQRVDMSIRRFMGRATSMLLASLMVPLHAQQPPALKDPSPHTTRFVTVDKEVRLEVLDWGGSGRPLVLLAGGGDTAHVFDDFAPKLTPSFH